MQSHNEALDTLQGLGAATVQQRGFALRERCLHRPHGLFPHARQEVRVDIQGHRYRGVS